MKRSITLFLLTVLALSIAVPAFAQHDEMDTHVCDSTTILLLYVAEGDYGFHSMMDTSTFEKGQYASAFEEMMAMMDDMGDDMAEDDMGDDMGDDMAGDDMGDDMMVTLTLPVIADDDPACTELRAELDTFFYEALTGMMMDDMGSDG